MRIKIRKPNFEFDHDQISPLQRVTLAGVHEGDHIIYYGLNPEEKTPNYVKVEGNKDGFSQKPQDDSSVAYDSSEIELSAVKQELQYAITHRYANNVVDKLQRRIQAAEEYRGKTTSTS